MNPQLVIELLLLGCGTGFLAGLLGIGGGMLMVPFLTLILSHRGVDAGLAVKMAIATSMATIMFTSLSSVRAHHARGAIRDAGKVKARERIAVLAALNLAYALAQRPLPRAAAAVAPGVDLAVLAHRLDEALADDGQLL